MTKQPVELRTLGDLESGNIDVYVQCDDPVCDNPGAFRLDDLIALRGRDHPYMEISCICAKCGGPAGWRLVTPC